MRTGQDLAQRTGLASVEWPTVGLIASCYVAWAVLIWVSKIFPPELSMVWCPFLILVMAFHSSLQHEASHGHPTRKDWINEALVFVSLGLFIPYRRFRDLHLTHHRDPNLTDPYDDPESFYLCPKRWQGLPRPVRRVLIANNTLIGRFFLGPLVSLVCFFRDEFQRFRDNAPGVRMAWLLHLPVVIGLLTLAHFALRGGIPVYLICAYFAMSVLMIRTFLEHQAHEHSRCRSVVIEKGGVLGFLFLNNHLHIVHHTCPDAAWYQLPALYRSKRDWFLRLNGGYSYRSYWDVLKLHAFRAKESVPHPMMR